MHARRGDEALVGAEGEEGTFVDAAPTRLVVGRVTLKPVGADDWRDVAGLGVSESQRAFVAEPAYYLTMGVTRPPRTVTGL